MNAMEAAHLVAWLKGLFPKMTLEQADFWTDRFLPREVAPVERAVTRYAEQNGEWVDRPKLLALMDAESNWLRQPRFDRVRESERLRREAEDVDKFIAELSESRLAKLKADALREIQDPAIRTKLEQADPRRSATLKGIIYDIAKSKGAVAA